MTRHEEDREDLFAELKSAAPRWELEVSGQPPADSIGRQISHTFGNSATVVAGTRSKGRFSIYFGADPCFHFDADGRLARAFSGGLLYRTQGETLARLARQRTTSETQLLRHDLTQEELGHFLTEMRRLLQSLLDSLRTGAVSILRCEPVDADLAVLDRRLQICLKADPPLAPRFRTRP